MDFGIVIHGGAGSFVPGSTKEYSERQAYLRKSINEGFRALAAKESATAAVEAAIQVMEDSGVFNSGAGSSLTVTGEVLTDAAIMNGDLQCGAVAAANVAKNPISLARAVMEKSDHVLLAGTANLSAFAESIGYPISPIPPSNLRKKQHRKFVELARKRKLPEWPRNEKLLPRYIRKAREYSDTVGAVAIDSRGRLCAGVSTGGRWMKLPGRIGDSALVGAGLCADDNAGAASATGAGEEIIKVGLCRMVCTFMRLGADAQSACYSAISLMSRSRGTGTAGVIAVDRFGGYGSSRNTEMMTRAFRFKSMPKAHIAILPGDQDPPHLGKSKEKFIF